MEINSVEITTPPRAAFNAMMLRDGVQGLEAFLLKCQVLLDVLVGTDVFPGEKISITDVHLRQDRTWHESHALANLSDTSKQL